jgi:hypothetical protein
MVYWNNLWFPYKAGTQVQIYEAGKSVDAFPKLPYGYIPPIPTLFVPGFGASLNPAVFAQAVPSSSPDLHGWFFFMPIVSGYAGLLRDLRENAIPHGIAYYDWRLPAERIAREYLKPAIDQLKRAYNVPVVNIIAHSYGGIVSRQYIQSDAYGFDVAQLITLGTPHLGSLKVYQVWEGAQLPEDWSILENLLRYYQLQTGTQNRLESIRSYFPGAKDLLPIYPAIVENGASRLPQDWVQRNETLLTLQRNLVTLLNRVPILAGYSDEESMDSVEKVVPHSVTDGPFWDDGRPDLLSTPLASLGDSTVIKDSAAPSEFSSIRFPGLHMELPAKASQTILHRLYPNKTVKAASQSSLPSRFVSLFVDCPVSVAVTLPDGRVISSANAVQADPYGDAGDYEVMGNGDYYWFYLPVEDGEYHVSTTALSDTAVRMWVDEHTPMHFSLRAGDNRQLRFVAQPDGSSPISFLEQGALPTEKVSLTNSSVTVKVLITQVNQEGSEDEDRSHPLHESEFLVGRDVYGESLDRPQFGASRVRASISRLMFPEEHRWHQMPPDYEVHLQLGRYEGERIQRPPPLLVW